MEEPVNSKDPTEGGQTSEAAKPVTPPEAVGPFVQSPEGEAARERTGPRLTPELRAWLLQQSTEEEIVAGLRELREKGGLEFHEFVRELEQVVHGGEPTER
jgi:hypothetical protein